MKIGRYEIIKTLGKGSMGVVYQARDPQIDRLVALKILREDRLSSDSYVKRFLKEAKAIGRLSHPNIVTVYDVGEDNRTIYIAMEFLEGRSLSDVIESKAFESDAIQGIGIQVAETLHYAHQKGVVHRDIKPSNIIVQPDGVIKITDFGIAHIEDASSTLQTQAGEILGTPAYMSPEQVQGKAVDGRSDLYSLGVILYEMSSGVRPFGRETKNLVTIFNEISHRNPPEPSVENPRVDKELSRIIMSCLNKAPEKRFQTGKELADALRNYQQEKSTLIESGRYYALPGRRYAALSVILALLVGLVFAGVAFKYFRGGRADHAEQAPPGATLPTGLEKEPPSGGEGKPPVESAFLKVASAPAGAQVYVDGVSRGTAPVRLDLPFGKHDVRVVLKDHSEWEESVLMNEGKEYALEATLKPVVNTGKVSIDSTPEGALVYVDDLPMGQTPLKLDLPLGRHAIRMALSDYRDWADSVLLNEAREYPVKAALERIAKTGTLSITSAPAGAQVYVDQTLRGETPLKLDLPFGKHAIRVALKDHADWTDSVLLNEAKEYPVVASLKPIVKTGTVSITSAPAGAQVYVDQTLRGETPLKLDLPLGKHAIRVTLKDHSDWTDNVLVNEAKEYPVAASLKPIVQTGTVSITSAPAGGQVYVDDLPVGQTPLKLDLPLGKHAVRVTLKDHSDWAESVLLKDAKEYPVEASLKPIAKTGTVSITSAPAGAQVYVDEAPAGRTPVKLDLPLGKHAVRMTLKDYSDWTESVLMNEAKEYPVKASLKPIAKTGTVSITSAPTGAQVYVDGKPKGATPAHLAVPVGEHLVRLELPNHQEWKQRINVKEPKEYPFNVELKPLPKQALLSITSVPSGAEVKIDGKRRGKTPFEKELPLGSYTVELSLADHDVWKERIDLKESKKRPVVANLKPQQKSAYLKIASTPSGAHVYVDGASKGRTPIELRLNPGRHEVRMTLEKYQDWNNSVQLKEAEKYPLNVRMAPNIKADDWGIGEWRSREVTGK